MAGVIYIVDEFIVRNFSYELRLGILVSTGVVAYGVGVISSGLHHEFLSALRSKKNK
jgi:hypothetical protein